MASPGSYGAFILTQGVPGGAVWQAGGSSAAGKGGFASWDQGLTTAPLQTLWA